MLDIVLTLVLAALFLLAMLVWSVKRERDFKRKWPTISDDEFVAMCSPGTDRNRALKVRRIIAEQLGIPYEHIHPEQSFVDDLDCC